MKTWVLAGQSNMEGAGLLDGPYRVTAVDPRLSVLSSTGRWVDAEEPLHRPWESRWPVHRDILRERLNAVAGGIPGDEFAFREAKRLGIGAGLGPSFGSRLADLTGEEVGLIPCAQGATSLDQWSPGHRGRDRRSTETLYGAMLGRVEFALERPDVQLAGVLWYQGEQDATPELSEHYEPRLSSWIAELRADVDMPELPVAVVQLARFGYSEDRGGITEQGWDRIREAQRRIGDVVPGAMVVGANDLGLVDQIHVDSAGLARLGRRLATVVYRGFGGPDIDAVCPAPPTPHGLLRLRVICRRVTGRWTQAEHIPGFTLHRSEGGAKVGVIDARPDIADPTSILITTSTTDPQALDGLTLSYGTGLDPVCRLVDEADLSLTSALACELRPERRDT